MRPRIGLASINREFVHYLYFQTPHTCVSVCLFVFPIICYLLDYLELV